MPFTTEQQRIRGCIDAATAETPWLEITYRAMFGGLMLYTAMKPFAVVAEQGLSLKLAETDREALLQEPGAEPMQHDGEAPSKQYVVVPEHILTDPSCLHVWIERSVAYVASQPERKPRAAKKTTPKKKA
jgi:TfoX/Sxy family transcriptional regulator of competence genes